MLLVLMSDVKALYLVYLTVFDLYLLKFDAELPKPASLRAICHRYIIPHHDFQSILSRCLLGCLPEGY